MLFRYMVLERVISRHQS